jgi:putative transposase
LFVSPIEREITVKIRDFFYCGIWVDAKRTGRAENYKLWRDDNHAIDLTKRHAMEKEDYIHQNPARTGWVEFPSHYIYSSAKDYAGEKGLVKVEII